MPIVTIRHTTIYHYAQPVTFGEHRLMFRPRDSHDLRLLDTALEISPRARVRWYHDVFGNSIAVASFADAAPELRFVSTIRLEHFPPSGPDVAVEPYARTYPFSYSAAEIPDLGRTIERHYPDPEHRIDAWARQFVAASGPTDTEAMLVSMTRAVQATLAYQWREEEGTQSPVETLDKGSGSCRDLALFMMEAARSLGLAARFVSGYLYDSQAVGGGATHAWVQLYLPGAGWVELDPTNGLIGGANLVRVAVARDPTQAIPLSGSFVGVPGDSLGLTVDVTVIPEPPPA
ncbi:MAG TPA: transglutaminase family protein [Candidatus Binatia bacterium]|nr:transglutaminase family protein [Candidatus Binatia bacterium]